MNRKEKAYFIMQKIAGILLGIVAIFIAFATKEGTCSLVLMMVGMYLVCTTGMFFDNDLKKDIIEEKSKIEKGD